MTTDQEALNRIFEAALKEAETPSTPSAGTRVRSSQVRKPAKTPIEDNPYERRARAMQEARNQQRRRSDNERTVTPERPAKPTQFREEQPAARTATSPQPVLAIDRDTEDELGKLLDEKIAKEQQGRKQGMFTTCLLLVGLIVGGATWILSPNDRGDTSNPSGKETRSTTDVKKAAGNHPDTPDRASVSGTRLDQTSMGLSTSAAINNGEEAQVMQAAFGAHAQQAGATLKANQEISRQDSFLVD